MVLLASFDIPNIFQYAFIKVGYRSPHLGYWQCYHTIFQLHNDTVNIWTHLLAAVGFWGLTVWYYFIKDQYSLYCHEPIRILAIWHYYLHNCIPARLKEYLREPRLPFKGPTNNKSHRVIAQFCAAQACVYSASFYAHTFHILSIRRHQLLFQIHWNMICIAMFGACAMAAFFCFFHRAQLLLFWRNCFLFSFMVMLIVVNTSSFASLPPSLKTMGPLIPAPCMAAFLLAVIRTLPKAEGWKFIKDLMGPLILAFLGLFMYGTTVPERGYPGHFDYSGGSHTLNHYFTVASSIWMVNKADQWAKWRQVSMPK